MRSFPCDLQNASGAAHRTAESARIHTKECILATERRSAGPAGGAERSAEKPRRPRRALVFPGELVRNAPKFNRRAAQFSGTARALISRRPAGN